MRTDRDQLAQRAARYMFDDGALDVSKAIEQASKALGKKGLQPPRRSLVLRHLHAMQEVAFGEAGVKAQRQEQQRLIVELLDLVDSLTRPQAIVIAGRVAQGHMEGPLEVFVRVYEGAPLESIVQDLEEAGVRDVSFATAESRFGRFPRLVFVSDGIRFVLTRCPRELYDERGLDLFKGSPIPVIGLEELRMCLDDNEGGGLTPDRP